MALKSSLIINTHPDDLKKVLRMVILKLGLREKNLPGPEEKNILILHIVSNFGGHRLDEINLAFDMAINGKLEIDDPNPYENFSCAYFSKIMNAYQSWSKQAYVSIKQIPDQRIYKQQQLDDFARRDIEIAYQLMRNGKVPYGLPEYFKDLLVKDGLMKPEDDLSAFFVQRLGRNVENIYVPA